MDNPAPAAASRKRDNSPRSAASAPGRSDISGRRSSDDVVPGVASTRAVAPSNDSVPAATTVASPAAAISAPKPSAATSTHIKQCAACLGLTAPTVGQGIVTAINHLFNNAFDLLGTLPANPISNLLEGGLVLVRRALFGFVPTGVSATQTGDSLKVDVNTGSVAYFRTTGTTLEVSGDPGFAKSQQFTASAVAHVVADNPGNAGCAGFVFTEGTQGSDLVTTGIDSMRFGATAAFAGEVTAGAVHGNLTLRQAVRGLGGVTFDAPVILAGDTEVDAGLESVTFNDTVDGTGWFGGQSLLVTALKTTTFAGNVGSRTPLGDLTTRGITPLQIQQSADSKTIPLRYMPIGSEVKYGIDVAIGGNTPRTYLFDTGGNGFFAGYDAAAFKGVTPTNETTQITYTSGQTLNALVTPANITIGTGKQTVSTATPVDIAAVVSATNGSGQPISPNAPFGTQFAGDFGAAFGVQRINGKLLYVPGSFITSVLFQLPGNLSSGYLTQLGPIGTTPQMTVGITDALRDQFTYAIPISEVPAPVDPEYQVSAGSYPVSGYPLLQQFGFNADYKVIGPFPFIPLPVPIGDGPLPSLIDSGAGSTSVRLPGLNKPFEDPATNTLLAGSTFIADFPTTQGRDALSWQYTAGSIGSVNQVGYLNETGAAITVPNVNTGLNLFNQYDVMYDVAEQVIWLRPNGGQANVILQSVTTRGDQSYGQNAQLNGTYTTNGGDFSVDGITTLNGSTVVDTRRGNVTFSGTVNARTAGVQWLQADSRGTTTFVRQVGSVNPLASLITDDRGTTSTAGVSTTGAQTYGDDLTVNGAYSTTSGAFTAAKSTTLAGGTSVSTVGAPITFTGRVDSADGLGNVLGVSAKNSTVQFGAAVGSTTKKSALGGLNVTATSSVTAQDSVTLSGSLPNSQGAGLFIGDGVTANFAHGGTISSFTDNGVQFAGDSPSTVLRGFHIENNAYDGIQLGGKNYAGALIDGNTIIGNSAFGIETLQATTGLTISNNTIGNKGDTNGSGYVSNGPNAQGIVLAPGTYTATVIANNTIQYNRRDGITAPNGVQGLVISGNTIQSNQGNGIEFTGGDFTGTVITGNTISGNGTGIVNDKHTGFSGDGILLGAGIGQGLKYFGNPLDGYQDSTGTQDQNPYAAGHYTLPWATDPGFYTNPVPADPQVNVKLDGGPTLTVNLDTGSRGLYFDVNRVSDLDMSKGTPGFVYLNSSNRLYFGTWVTTEITFPDSTWVGPDDEDTPTVATAEAPVLVVTALSASMTPPPGSTSPTAVFFTTTDNGFVTITNGTETRKVAITPGPNGSGSVTIPGGFWATYKDNPALGPVANFGVGFDRTGLGTEPTSNGTNQEYNVFLNLKQMSEGTMRPGYIIANDGVTLGLDRAALQGNSYAYTDLAPSGLSRGKQTAPDWQPATGRVTWAPGDGQPNQVGDPGPLVIDIGIPTGILTLPGEGASSTFTGFLDVDLLNSGGSISYTVDPTDKTNQMTATSVAFFNPLAGAYSQNMPPLSQQFFNTGRRLIAGMNYLYDAAGGFEGLWAPTDPLDMSPQAKAFRSGNGEFEAAHFVNGNIPAGVTNLVIQNNTISGNGNKVTGFGNGITINGDTSTGNVLNGNLIYGNAVRGISLTNGGNGNQPPPVITRAIIIPPVVDPPVVQITGTVSRIGGYTGPMQVQLFNNPASDAGNVQGRQLLGTVVTDTDDFVAVYLASLTAPGDFITAVATPTKGTPNSSEFSARATVA